MSKKQLAIDAATIVAAVALVCSGVGWVISVERRMASRVTNETFYADQKLQSEVLSGQTQNLKTELDTDVRGLRDRLNAFQCPACPPCQ